MFDTTAAKRVLIVINVHSIDCEQEILIATKGNQMNIVSKLLIASAIALSFAAPALAQESRPNVYIFMPNGQMVKMEVNESTQPMIMKHFKRMRVGTMVYVNAGRVYVAQDRMMHGGRMMSEMIFGSAAAQGTSH